MFLNFRTLLFAFLLLPVQTVCADLIVSIQSLNIQAGQTADLELAIDGADDPLSIFGLELRITPQLGTTSNLRFREENESFLSDPFYVFPDSSARTDNQSSSFGFVSTTLLPADTFFAVDSVNTLTDVFVSDTRLLATVTVQHTFAPADAVTTLGHSFSIELVSANGDSVSFVNGTSSTGFADKAFSPIPYTSNVGTVRITAVPEPGSCLVLLMLIPLIRSRRHL